ncbi:vesicle transport protein SEC20-like [Saccoglossus kowalevskii]|uniref:Vesicle transport protein SEC20-like n=1 Tax=Saccoglossus kowalevskii TaxID=10224 RepID=A0ABM0GKK4_SACKO|nr:PREDICTED: vesicle transport protein SEC20-like [Saccoglossus kowalevskii]
MAADDVHVRLCVQEIVKHDLHVKALIQDIRDIANTEEKLNDINLQIKEKIQALRNRIDDLERFAKEQDKETDKVNLLRDVDNHRKQLHSTQTALRKANLACKLQIDRNAKEDLLKGGTDPDIRKRKNKEHMAKTATNITENLMSISRLMASSVKQSEETMHTLVNSSKTIQETHEEFKGMGGVIQTSRKLLTKYNRREITDKLLIIIALALFFATVFYILKKRLF